MIILYDSESRFHDPTHEIHRGERVPCFERQERVDLILTRIREAGFGEVESPLAQDELSGILRVHRQDYVEFLQSIVERWEREAGGGSPVPYVWPSRNSGSVPSQNVHGQLGYYSSDSGTPMTAGTWRAAMAAARTALEGADRLLAGAPSVFGITRPPGHHASSDVMGGYCFLNNAAIAAQALLDGGAHRVAILDVDYHHGNGTQQIFYERGDVLFVSVHADPDHAYPYFLGRGDECGEGEGKGFNLNLPLPFGTGIASYGDAIELALARIRDLRPDHLIVSLGLDTFVGDPICSFDLSTTDYMTVGAKIASAGLPTLFMLEGGYAIDELGVNTVTLLDAFERARAGS